MKEIISKANEWSRNDLSDLATFAIVAEERSFTRAAGRLGVSQSALSQTIRALERRFGLQLLARTTRSVSPTAAGSALLSDLAPALERISSSLARVRRLRAQPSGRIRLVLARSAACMVLMPRLARFCSEYPEIFLEITVSNDIFDVVAGEFDAGIQINEFIQHDMVAVRVSDDLRLVAVGSPEYFKTRKVPRTPYDLKDHLCIGFRFRSGVYRWEFEKGRRQVTVNPQGPASFDDASLVTDAALSGVGLGFCLENEVAPYIQEGRLTQVLADWCTPFPGFFLYYPSRRHQPAALTALINSLRIKG